MKKSILKTISIFIAFLIALTPIAAVNGNELKTPAVSNNERHKGNTKTLYLKVPYYADGQFLSTKSFSEYSSFNAAVGDVFQLTLNCEDDSTVVNWTTDNPQGLSFTVDNNDSRNCEVTILSYQHGTVSITASANGNSICYSFNNVATEIYSAEIDDVFDLYLTSVNGGSLSGYSGNITWETLNPSDVEMNVDPHNKAHCTITILSFNNGEIPILASVDGREYRYVFKYFEDVWESMLYSESTEYSKRMALLSTELCDAANDTNDEKINDLYKEYDFKNIAPENYSNFGINGNDLVSANAYTIGYKEFDNTVILAVTLRGTTSLREIIGDGMKGEPRDLHETGIKIYNNVYEYEEAVWDGMEKYVSNNQKILDADEIVIFITGHSLGGACANALAARIDKSLSKGLNSWLSKAKFHSTYCYTLGAIKVLPEEGDSITPNISDGYENIHNIYNFYDQWGQNGSGAISEVGSIYAKFGHTDLFAICNNDTHNLTTYRAAIMDESIYHFDCDINPNEQEIYIDGNKGRVELFFDENWFDADSKEYNHEICQFAAKFAMFGYNQEDGQGNQNELIAGLKKCGFDTDNMDRNNHTNETEVNYFITSRKINDKNLVFIALIGTQDYQWYSDFESGSGNRHTGFSSSESFILGKLEKFIYDKGFSKENTKILITGHSRGAATANLLAADLINDQKYARIENIFTYTFATPRCVKESSDDVYDADYKLKNGDNAVKYTRIFNIVNPEDFVPKCMPYQWGYTRYGRTFSLPTKTNDADYARKLVNVQTQVAKYGAKYIPFEKGEAATYEVIQKMTSVWTTAESYYNESVKENFNSKVSESGIGYYEKIGLKEFFYKTLCKFLANSALKDKYPGSDFEKEYNEAYNLILSIFGGSKEVGRTFHYIINYFVGNEGIGDVSQSLVSEKYFTYAHQSQTYCAWVCTLSKDELINNNKREEGTCSGEWGCYKGVANCPVDVEIYKKMTGELVGRIKDNAVDEEIASKPNSVVMTVNGDSKSFWLPSDGDYDVKLIGNDNGTMDYTLAQIDSDAGEVKRVNYFDVPITANEVWSGTTSSEDFEIEEHTLTSADGTVLTYSEDINQEEKEFNVEISVEGNGTADTSRTAVSGDYVAVTATPDEGNTFDGWYENGELLTTDAEYAFVAKSNRTLVAKFSENVSEQKYTATFVADGNVIKTIEFTAGTTNIEEPDVPYKEGYTGRWSEYVLAASNVTINAIYEKVFDNPTANAVINVAGEKAIKYRTKVTIKATAANLDSGYHLVLCIDGKEIKGSNKEVSYEYGELKSDVNYSVKIVNESNITQKDKDGKALEKSGGKITCNAGFFVKIIAFFQGLFNALPSETVEPKK